MNILVGIRFGYGEKMAISAREPHASHMSLAMRKSSFICIPDKVDSHVSHDSQMNL